VTYNPAQLTPIDVIRGMGGDTSNDPTAELMVDAEYAAILGRFGVGSAPGTDVTTAAFNRAAADALRSLAVRIEQQPTSLGSPTDGSIGWSARTSSLREQARVLDAKADKLDAEAADGFWGPTVTVRGNFLTGTVTGGAEW
jgi:hypothetical protein